MKRQTQVLAPPSAAIDWKRKGTSIVPPEGLPPDFPLEEAVLNLMARYAEAQVKLLREGLPQPWPKKMAPSRAGGAGE